MSYQKIELEGNKGGDRFEVTINEKTFKNGTVELIVGHCCVYMIKAVVPVEFLTAALSKVVNDAGGVEEAIRKFGWSEKFTEQLIEKVESLDTWNIEDDEKESDD